MYSRCGGGQHIRRWVTRDLHAGVGAICHRGAAVSRGSQGPWGCRVYRKALRLLDLLSDLPSRVDTIKTSYGSVADFLDRGWQIFRALWIFRSYATCGLLDLQPMTMDASPKRSAKFASKWSAKSATWVTKMQKRRSDDRPPRVSKVKKNLCRLRAESLLCRPSQSP